MNFTTVLKKTHSKSFFKQFHSNSEFAKHVFNDGTNKIVLQVAKVGDENYLAELVYKEDY